MHLTLAFLGTTPDAQVANVADAVRGAAHDTRAFHASFERVGRFPDHGDPRVVWLGVGDGATQLDELAQRVRRALASRGLPFDDKPFRAHVTLARVREAVDRGQARAIARVVDQAAAPRATFDVDTLVVYESVVSSKGPRYTARATAPLGGGPA